MDEIKIFCIQKMNNDIKIGQCFSISTYDYNYTSLSLWLPIYGPIKKEFFITLEKKRKQSINKILEYV